MMLTHGGFGEGRVGQADVTMETTEMFIPQMLNLDVQDYISFSKGCYTVKRWLHEPITEVLLSVECICSHCRAHHYPSPRTIFDTDNKPLGNIVNAAIESDDPGHGSASILSEDALSCDQVQIGDQVISASYLNLPYQVP